MLNQGGSSTDPVMLAIANVCVNKKKEIEEIVRSTCRDHHSIQEYLFLRQGIGIYCQQVQERPEKA